MLGCTWKDIVGGVGKDTMLFLDGRVDLLRPASIPKASEPSRTNLKSFCLNFMMNKVHVLVC